MLAPFLHPPTTAPKIVAFSTAGQSAASQILPLHPPLVPADSRNLDGRSSDVARMGEAALYPMNARPVLADNRRFILSSQ